MRLQQMSIVLTGIILLASAAGALALNITPKPPAASPAPVPAAAAASAATPSAHPQSVAAGHPSGKIDFNRDIRPIFSENCYACHGPDKGHRKAELRLDTRDGLFTMKDDVYPVVPGKIDDSLIYMRITSDDPDFRMPAKGSNKHLTPQQIDLIKRWIEQGAPWEGHWAYTPPKATTVPSVQMPAGFVRNPIDQFIGAKLQEVGLSPSPEADKATLLRRVSLDLTGLPPTPQELDAFIADTSPDAYEKQVDRLLASPHYGERMAQFWMDLVRYADTIGYHSDNSREVWPWRDWCINSFNRNEPFNQFTIEQIAGDLLPNATRDQKVASGYNRLLLTTGEGGAQAKQYVAMYAEDRVRNVSTTWMGSTMGCCMCHDHKFDPFTQKDFYRMAAFFADIQEPAISLPQPELALPSPQQEAQQKQLAQQIADVMATLNTNTPALAAAQAEFEKNFHQVQQTSAWQPLTVTSAKSAGGATLTIQKDQSVLASGASPLTDTYEIRAVTRMKNITGLKLEVLPDPSLPAGGPGRAANGNFVLSEIDVQETGGMPVAFTAASASFEQTDVAQGNPYGRWPAVATIDGDKYGAKWGWAILNRAGQPNHIVYQTPVDIGDGREVSLQIKLQMNLGDRHTLGHFRFFLTDSPRPIRAVPASDLPPAIVKILQTPPTQRSAADVAALAAHYRTIAPLLEPARQELAKFNKDLADLNAQIPRTLISVSGPPRVVRVLNRGDWQDDKGEIVSPGVPAFLPQIQVPVERGASRLDLANWLVARDNPLTARCFVNRLWKLFYGEGIATPLDDMGSQGHWPTHPHLLDYMAVQFMDSGWDVKRAVRLMVTSGTYRQSSRITPELKEKDPFNRYLARQGSFRLDAEFVRDGALSIAGLLSPKLGGPSVKPYQPAGYWVFLNFPKRTYDQGHGEALYRRGLYTWWQRTFLNPELLNFDAPSHEECVAERTRSNTPQQALTLLNDPTYVEAARVFAAKVLTDCHGSDAQRIEWAFRRALLRRPSAAELPILSALLNQQRQRYLKDVPAATALIHTGEAPAAANIPPTELAAWTSVTRSILNLHETITRD